jgi:hypothetical protein
MARLEPPARRHRHILTVPEVTEVCPYAAGVPAEKDGFTLKLNESI